MGCQDARHDGHDGVSHGNEMTGDRLLYSKTVQVEQLESY